MVSRAGFLTKKRKMTMPECKTLDVSKLTPSEIVFLHETVSTLSEIFKCHLEGGVIVEGLCNKEAVTGILAAVDEAMDEINGHITHICRCSGKAIHVLTEPSGKTH